MQGGKEKGWKVVLLGNSGTGKTSLIHYMMGAPNKNTVPTIMCQGNSISVDTGSEVVDLRVWDTAGQEVYRSIVPIYLRNAAAALLVYDATDMKSFQAIEKWHSLLMEEARENVIVFIVENKIDLPNGIVTEQQSQCLAQELNAKLRRVCAISGAGVRDLFVDVAKAVAGFERYTEDHPIAVHGETEKAGGGCC